VWAATLVFLICVVESGAGRHDVVRRLCRYGSRVDDLVGELCVVSECNFTYTLECQLHLVGGD